MGFFAGGASSGSDEACDALASRPRGLLGCDLRGVMGMSRWTDDCDEKNEVPCEVETEACEEALDVDWDDLRLGQLVKALVSALVAMCFARLPYR